MIYLIQKIQKVYEIFDFIKQGLEVNEFFIAYSGGKDSTALTLLFLEWLIGKKETNISRIEIFHNDTLAEIPVMERWARKFMRKITEIGRNYGFNFDYTIIQPEAKDTLYYKVIVRGYPAPTFKFRWCTWILKRKPTIKHLKIVNSRKKGIVLLGLRDDESSARNFALSKRTKNVPGKGLEYYILSSEDYNKVTPIRDWNDNDVWTFLKYMNSKYSGLISDIFKLYKYKNIRYGCWFCTLLSIQKANFIDNKYKYYEIGRLIYKIISDNKKFRLIKRVKNGYSSLGGLNKYGRAIMYRLFKAIEDLSNEKLYGLDEAYIYKYTLRKVFYYMDPSEANEIINEYDLITPRRTELDADFYEISKLKTTELQSYLRQILLDYEHFYRKKDYPDLRQNLEEIIDYIKYLIK